MSNDPISGNAFDGKRRKKGGWPYLYIFYQERDPFRFVSKDYCKADLKQRAPIVFQREYLSCTFFL